MKVLIVRPNMDYIHMFNKRGHEVVQDLKDADLVQFTGGADVHPSLYGQEEHPRTYADQMRDDDDILAFTRANRWCIPVAGICRGGQFLNVMNGGSMHQHVDGHTAGRGHIMHTTDGREIEVTSTHHQMMIPHAEGDVLATAKESTYREHMEEGKVVRETWKHSDTEVVWYTKTQSLCFQPHPEYLGTKHPCQDYYFELLHELMGVS